MTRWQILSEFFSYLKTHKKWWLFPIIFLLLILGILVVLVEGSAIAPFIYTLF